MAEGLKNIFLYFSAFIPMYFLIMVKFIVDLIFDNVNACGFTIAVLCILALLIILGIFGLFWNIKWNDDQTQTIIIKTSKNITDQYFLGYFAIFILFALTFDLALVSMFVIFVFITIFVGIVYIKNKLFYINPFLNILGFNFYEITYTMQDHSLNESNASLLHNTSSLDNEQKHLSVRLSRDPSTKNLAIIPRLQKTRTAKLFYRGDLKPSQIPYQIKLKNDHFSFIDKDPDML